jgi:gamma-glutamylcyclotransferase (GGCT)/AIG2-like uncharacterized protein YtfP
MRAACYYFAYGSNMNPARVAARGLRFGDVESAWVDDFRLVFDKEARDHAGVGHANIVRHRGGRVEGVLYTLADESELLKMDVYERTPVNYSRDRLDVETAAGRTVAWTYFANPAVRRPNLRPSRDYLAHLLAGRRFLSTSYVRGLEQLPTCDGD